MKLGILITSCIFALLTCHYLYLMRAEFKAMEERVAGIVERAVRP